MKLDLATVEHIAMLARLGLSDAEKESMREQLSSILSHIEVLQEVDTDDIPPTAQVIELQNILRDDEVEPSLTVEEVLQNAPRTEGDYIRVNAILDQS